MITFLTRDSQEWDRAWERIKIMYGDTTCEDPETGEVWQYMGTVGCEDHTSQSFVHEFRHRCHKGQRKYEKVPASRGWHPEHEPA